MVTIIVLMMPFTVVQSKTGQHFIMLNHQNHLVAFFEVLKVCEFCFYDFIFTKDLLQSSHELIQTKQYWGNAFNLSHKYMTSMIHLGSNNIKIFCDFEIQSHSLYFSYRPWHS